MSCSSSGRGVPEELLVDTSISQSLVSRLAEIIGGTRDFLTAGRGEGHAAGAYGDGDRWRHRGTGGGARAAQGRDRGDRLRGVGHRLRRGGWRPDAGAERDGGAR